MEAPSLPTDAPLSEQLRFCREHPWATLHFLRQVGDWWIEEAERLEELERRANEAPGTQLSLWEERP